MLRIKAGIYLCGVRSFLCHVKNEMSNILQSYTISSTLNIKDKLLSSKTVMLERILRLLQ